MMNRQVGFVQAGPACAPSTPAVPVCTAACSLLCRCTLARAACCTARPPALHCGHWLAGPQRRTSAAGPLPALLRLPCSATRCLPAMLCLPCSQVIGKIVLLPQPRSML